MANTASLRPEWISFEQELGFRPLITGPTAEDIRKQDIELGTALFQKYAADFPPVDPSVVVTEHKTASGVRLKSYTPPNNSSANPVVCYMHGGGFVVGSVDLDDSLVSRFAKDTELVFVSVEYGLAPENPYPAGLNDCVEAAIWCIGQAQVLKSNGSIIPMGGSAGACLALGTTLKLIEQGKGSSLQGVVACQPMTLHPDHVPDEYQAQYSSYDRNATQTLNTAQGMRAFFEIHGASPTDPYIQCLHHPLLAELPPIYINACEYDTLVDDAKALKRKLDTLSVLNNYDEYPGLPHYFFVFPSPCLEKVRNEYHEKTTKGIKFLLGS